MFNDTYFFGQPKNDPVPNKEPQVTYLSSPIPQQPPQTFSPSFLDTPTEPALGAASVDELPLQSTPSENIQKIDTAKIKLVLSDIQNQIDKLFKLIEGVEVLEIPKKEIVPQPARQIDIPFETNSDSIFGIFMGDCMHGPDGKTYSIPPNYASKSKLVEGDRLKLTIRDNGRFLYKQIGPIDRICVRGLLEQDSSDNQWYVVNDTKRYKVLDASITFYKGLPNDAVAILIPTKGSCTWGAVDNIIAS